MITFTNNSGIPKELVGRYITNSNGVPLKVTRVYKGTTEIWSEEKLPLGYFELEYIENTISTSSCAYIDSGVVTNSDIKVKIEYKIKENNNYQTPFGSSNQNIDDYGGNFMIQANFLELGSFLGNHYTIFDLDAIGTKHTCIISTSECTYDGITPSGFGSGYVKTYDYNLYIFANNRGNTVDAPMVGEIYSCKIWNNNILVRNFIPCLSPNNEVGLYDAVSKTFFKSPNNVAFVAGPKVIPTYTDKDYYGVRWREVDGQIVGMERIGNMNWHRTLPIHNQMKRCYRGSDNSVRYVSDTDYTKDTQGNTIPYTSTNYNDVTYDTFVEMPAHYYLAAVEEVDGIFYNVLKLFPRKAVGEFVPKHYMGAFEAMLDRSNNKLYSTVKTNIVYDENDKVSWNANAFSTDATTFRGANNTSSNDSNAAKSGLGRAATSINIFNFCTYATNRGTGYGIINWAARNNLLRLYLVEYANFDCLQEFTEELTVDGFHQGGLGFGVVSTVDAWGAYNGYYPIMPCGVTLKLGNKTGIIKYDMGATYSSGATASNYFYVPSYRGIENPFGHIWEITTGMYIYGVNNLDYIYTAIDGFRARTFSSPGNNTAPSGYKLRSNNLPLAEGWPTSTNWTSDGDFLPNSIITGKSNTEDSWSITKDYFWGTNAGAKRLVVGGSLDASVRAGLFYFCVADAVANANANRGSRLLYVGTQQQ